MQTRSRQTPAFCKSAAPDVKIASRKTSGLLADARTVIKREAPRVTCASVESKRQCGRYAGAANAKRLKAIAARLTFVEGEIAKLDAALGRGVAEI